MEICQNYNMGTWRIVLFRVDLFDNAKYPLDNSKELHRLLPFLHVIRNSTYTACFATCVIKMV